MRRRRSGRGRRARNRSRSGRQPGRRRRPRYSPNLRDRQRSNIMASRKRPPLSQRIILGPVHPPPLTRIGTATMGQGPSRHPPVRSTMAMRCRDPGLQLHIRSLTRQHPARLISLQLRFRTFGSGFSNGQCQPWASALRRHPHLAIIIRSRLMMVAFPDGRR